MLHKLCDYFLEYLTVFLLLRRLPSDSFFFQCQNQVLMYSGQALHQPKLSVVRFLVSLHKTFSAFILIFLLDTSQAGTYRTKYVNTVSFLNLCLLSTHQKQL